MPESTHPASGGRSRPPETPTYLLDTVFPLETTTATGSQALQVHGPVRGTDSPERVAVALEAFRTSVAQICDSLRLEGRPVTVMELAARRALDRHDRVRTRMDPADVAEALGALRAGLEVLVRATTGAPDPDPDPDPGAERRPGA